MASGVDYSRIHNKFVARNYMKLTPFSVTSFEFNCYCANWSSTAALVAVM
jgi:hypothetical protein